MRRTYNTDNLLTKTIKWLSGLLNPKTIAQTQTCNIEITRKVFEKLSDYKAYYQHNPTFVRLEESLNNLYDTFSRYQKPSQLTCCYREDIKYQLILNYDIKDSPLTLVEGLEFYDKHWGEMNEVKYLLPRIMEGIVVNAMGDLINEQLHMLDFTITGGAFIRNRVKPLSKWQQSEREAITNFINAFFEFWLHNSKSVSELLATCINLSSPDGEYLLNANWLIEQWNRVDPGLRKQQFQHFMNETYLADKQGGVFKAMNIDGFDVTRWVVSDEHILEFGFCDDTHYSEMILNDAISKKV